MDQELRELTLQISDLIRTLQSTSGTGGTSKRIDKEKDTGTEVVRSVDKMIVALGKVAVALDGSKKTKIAEEEAIKKFTKAVDKTTEELDKENAEREKSTRTIADETAARAREAKELEALRNKKIKEQGEDLSRMTKDLNDRIKNGGLFNASVLRNRDEMLKLGEDMNSTGATAGLLKQSFNELVGVATPTQLGLKFLGAGLEGAAKSLKGFATSLLDGKRGPEVTAKAFTDAIKPLTDLTSTVGTATMALGGIAMLIPGFQGVGIAAIAAGGALTGLAKGADLLAEYNERAAKQLAAQLNSMNELSRGGIAVDKGVDGIIDMVQTLGMTMSEIQEFNKLMVESNRNLAIMGGTSQRGAKAFSEVAGQLNKGKLGQELEYMGIEMGEQREITMSYMNILGRTGQLQLQNTTKLVESSANFAKELDLAAQLTGTTRKDQLEAREAAMAETRVRAALTKAIKDGDKTREAEIRRGIEIAAMYRKTLGEQAFTGALQLTASRGALTTDAAVETELSTGFTNLLTNTNLTVQQAYEQSVKNAVVQADTLADINSTVGDLKGFQLASVPIREEEARTAELTRAAAEKGFVGVNAIPDFIKAVQDGQIKVDKTTKDLIEGNRAQRAATQTLERGISEFNVAATLHNKASQTFADAVKMFGDAVGAKVPGGTTGYSGGASTGGGGTSTAPSPAAQRQTAVGSTMPGPSTGIRGSQSVPAGGLASMRSGGNVSGAPSTDKPIAEVIAAGPGVTVVRTMDGEEQRRQGVRNWRNNNPGNIEFGPFARQMGAVGSDGRFAVFSTLEAGTKAKEELLFGAKSKYIGLSIADAIARYAPPSENNTEAYIQQVVQAIGGTPQTRMADLTSSQRKTFLEAISRVEGFKQGTIVTAADGGMFKGPKSGYPAVLHGSEAVIPLKDGAVPVKLDLGSIGPTFAGYNQYTGYNMGPMSTDISAVKQIAESMGAYNKNTQTITDPETWKQIIQSGIATNYQLAEVKFGTEVMPNVGNIIGERLKEIQEKQNVDKSTALQSVAEEFRTAMREIISQMADSQGQLVPIMQELVKTNRDQYDVQKKLLQSNY